MSLGRAYPLPQAGVDFECPHGVTWGADSTPLAQPPPFTAPVSRDQWPLAARVLAKLATAEDAGLGSTLTRLLNTGGAGDLFKWAMGVLPGGCGCEKRAEWLDARFPLR
jgi:hypothetical protein